MYLNKLTVTELFYGIMKHHILKKRKLKITKESFMPTPKKQ